ncbi:LLM class flavin-dependent oxidoreductase [Olivibacter sitiensis]|uniref:LLM class flavin-dependent oxidoreductase n=1 Tax=Olivibacter sitiensis TaxID=376470 RepID=UPI000400B884|nr:LLM class flavin-dependent oxidoreductase [Olivibacter sitiensis]
MELGISMFADLPVDKATGKHKSAQERIQELIEEIKLADEVGLDVFGIGEHHREDYAVSSPEIILATAATVTKHIKLASAVTVLSSSDPVKVYQNFATIDLISNGRAELMVGRGSFIESFPLFGYDLKDYNKLFAEKLDLLLQINKNETVNWKGTVRAPLQNQKVLPRAVNDHLNIWIAAGGTPESVYRAAKLGLPLMIAIIGGYPMQFTPLFNLYKKEYEAHGHDMAKYQIGTHSHALIGENSQEIADLYYPYYAAQMDRVGKDRGWQPYTRAQFDMGRDREGALFVGEPAEVVDKILYQKEMFGLTRFVAHMDVGGAPHDVIMKSIELFGTKVAPEVRKSN